jgi:hypothetical protein
VDARQGKPTVHRYIRQQESAAELGSFRQPFAGTRFRKSLKPGSHILSGSYQTSLVQLVWARVSSLPRLSQRASANAAPQHNRRTFRFRRQQESAAEPCACTRRSIGRRAAFDIFHLCIPIHILNGVPKKRATSFGNSPKRRYAFWQWPEARLKLPDLSSYRAEIPATGFVQSDLLCVRRKL